MVVTQNGLASSASFEKPTARSEKRTRPHPQPKSIIFGNVHDYVANDASGPLFYTLFRS